MASRAKEKAPNQVKALRHTGDKLVNIPTAEHQSDAVMKVFRIE